MKLVVGLGNPGARYRDNRHNVGFWVVEQVGQTNGGGAWQARFDGLLDDVRIDTEKVLLLKPQTYMNRSGHPVRKAVDFYKLTLDDVLVVCDDFNLPLGKLRARPAGSSGGQNGLKDIFRHLGTEDVCRLRVGIGSAGNLDPADYVLTDFSTQQRKLIDETVITAGLAVECWCREGIDATMSRYNGLEPGKE